MGYLVLVLRDCQKPLNFLVVPKIIPIFASLSQIVSEKLLKQTVYIWLMALFLLFPSCLCAESASLLSSAPVLQKADSLMSRVIFFAPMYEDAVDSYKAQLYIKGLIHVRKQNFLLRFWPSIVSLRKGVREYMMEALGDLNYTSPNNYDHRVRAFTGTTSDFWRMDHRLPEYFHANVYAASLLNDKLISPVAPNAAKYYRYQLDSVWGSSHQREYKIRFIPRNKSFQLLDGYLVVTENVWSIREMSFTSHSEWFSTTVQLRMGEVGDADEFLPLSCRVNGSFGLLGNKIEGEYEAVLNYVEIVPRRPLPAGYETGKSRYDLTSSYVLRCDTNAYLCDTALLNSLRPVPLTAQEQRLYDDYYSQVSTALQKKKHRNKRREFWGEVGDVLLNNYTLNFAKLGSVRFSPLINPLLISYSGSNGISYRQQFKYNCLFPGDRLLHIVPQIGYNFTRKEFYWSVNADFDYWPQKRAAIHVDVGNGNRIYSSDVLDDLKAIPDSLFDFNKIHLDYFKDFYFRLRHTWEIVNGLTLDVGLSIHRRREAERSSFEFVYPETPPVRSVGGSNDKPVNPAFDPSVLNRFRHVYNSFAPRIALTWTPGQYYYMDGERKVNLYSRYPTISVDWERGIGGVLPNSGTYERLEVDYQHQIPLGLMRSFYYRLGWGKFTNQKELYFVDFANFSRRNLPVGWNDEIGGVFQLLDGGWYNSSREYIRGHLTYEAPFLLMRHLIKYTQYVLNERLYFNALVMPHLKPYLEIGYGIGTHIFDFGVFAGFANWKYNGIGCKFTFELFNR